jgi:hypothetical protein
LPGSQFTQSATPIIEICARKHNKEVNAKTGRAFLLLLFRNALRMPASSLPASSAKTSLRYL